MFIPVEASCKLLVHLHQTGGTWRRIEWSSQKCWHKQLSSYITDIITEHIKRSKQQTWKSRKIQNTRNPA